MSSQPYSLLQSSRFMVPAAVSRTLNKASSKLYPHFLSLELVSRGWRKTKVEGSAALLRGNSSIDQTDDICCGGCRQVRELGDPANTKRLRWRGGRAQCASLQETVFVTPLTQKTCGKTEMNLDRLLPKLSQLQARPKAGRR